MKRLVSSAVALLAGTVAMGALVQNASAATITWTSDTSNFTLLNPPPVGFNPIPNSCVNQCSNTLTGNSANDRSPYQNNPPNAANQFPGYQSLVYSAVQGAPTSAPSSASYFFGNAISISLLWGSPDTFNNLEFWFGQPGAPGSVDLGGLSGSKAHGDAVGGGPLPLTSPLQLGHDLLTFTVHGSFFDWLVFSTSTNAFEYTFVNGSVIRTPIPAALPLFATGLGALGMFGWRRKRKASTALAAA